jgi:hypothetical protein
MPLGILCRFRYRNLKTRGIKYAVPGLISRDETWLPTVSSCGYTRDVTTDLKCVTLDLIRGEGALRILIVRRGEFT